MRETLREQLEEWLTKQIERERQHLIDIGGPTGMRNSIGSATGLARNTARQEVLDWLHDHPETAPTRSEPHLVGIVTLAIEQADRENEIRRRMRDAVRSGDTEQIIALAKLWTCPDGE